MTPITAASTIDGTIRTFRSVTEAARWAGIHRLQICRYRDTGSPFIGIVWSTPTTPPAEQPRRCKLCKQIKPARLFPLRADSGTRRGQCIACWRAYQAWYFESKAYPRRKVRKNATIETAT